MSESTEAAILEYAKPLAADPGYKWRLAGFLFCSSALNYGDRSAITALFPLLRAEFGMSDVGLALIGSAFLWTYGICSPFAGVLADRIARGRLVIFSLFAWSFVTALTGTVHSSRMLWTMRGILGVVESLYLPASIALLAEHHPVSTRAKAIGFHITGLSLGMVAGGTISGYLGNRYGWRVPLFTLGGIGICVATVGIFVVGDGRVRDRDVGRLATPQAAVSLGESLRALARGLSMPSLLVLFFEYGFMGVGVWSLINWLPLYFNENFGMSLAKAALFGTAFFQVGSALGVLLGGIPSDRAARKHIGSRMMLFACFYLAAAPVMLVFLLHPSALMAAGVVLLFGLLRGMGQINSNPLVCELLPGEARSTGIGLTNMLACSAGGIGVLLSGKLKGRVGLAGVFASISFVTAVCGVLLLIAAIYWVRRDADLRTNLSTQLES